MNSKKKVLPQAMMGLALIALLLAGCSGAPAEPTATPVPPTPKVGRWRGEYVRFTVTTDGKLRDLLVEGDRAFDNRCRFSFKEDVPAANGRFEYQVGDAISLTLTFDTEATASVSYSYTMCPNPASISTSVHEGTRTATWQEP